MNLSSKSYVGCCVLLVMMSSMLGFGHLTPGHDWGGDFAQYIMQAKAIVDGAVPQFLEINRWTMEYSYRPIGPVAYPWGLPLLLAPLYAGWGTDLILFKLVAVAAWLGILALVAWYGWNRHGDAGIFLVAVFAFNPPLLSSLNQIGSDIPFMLASTASVMMMSGWGQMRGESPARLIGLGILVAVAALLRTNGVLLLIPLVVTQVMRWRESGTYRRTWRDVFTWNTAWPWLSFAMVFGVITAMLPEGGTSHVGHLTHVMPQTIYANLLYYFTLPLAFYEGVPWRHAVCLLNYALCLIGLLTRVRRDLPILLYVMVTLGVYVIWPDSMQGLRFLFPLLPFYLSFVLTGYSRLRDWLPLLAHGAVTVCGIGLSLFVVVSMGWCSLSAAWTNQQQGRPVPEGPYTQDARALFVAVEQNTQPGDHIVFFKPRVMRFMTGRPATIQRTPEQVPVGAFLVQYRDSQGLMWPIEEQKVQDAERRGLLELRTEAERYAIYHRIR